MNELEHVLGVQNRLGEGPLWNVGEGTLYWVDIEEHAFHRLDLASGRHECFDTGLPVGALAFRQGGGLVMATRDGFAIWDFGSQSLEFVADPEADRPHARFNDGRVDSRGRFWAGTMSEGDDNSLYRLDPGGEVRTMETGITIANGLGWSPDDRTMYFTDTRRNVIYAYDYDAGSGSISNRRTFVRTPEGEGSPDGMTVDSEGFVWSARWGGWKIVRYDPDGKVEREVKLPVSQPTSCAFGGRDLTDLYITSAWSGLNDNDRAGQPEAGDLFRLRTDIKGKSEQKFGVAGSR